MRIFNYSLVTSEFTGVSVADESPLEPGVFLVPAFATDVEPPPIGQNEAAVWKDSAWEVVPDFRGVALFSTADGSMIEVDQLGSKPEDSTDQPRPSPLHDWDGAAWVLNLVKARVHAWEAIKAKRDIIKSGGVKVGAKWYHTDTESRIQHLGLKDQARDIIAAGQPDSTRLQKLGQDVRWKTMDGTFIYLTAKHAFDIVAAVGDLDAMAFTVAETHKAAMEAAADPAAYDFSTNWPATFTG